MRYAHYMSAVMLTNLLANDVYGSAFRLCAMEAYPKCHCNLRS